VDEEKENQDEKTDVTSPDSSLEKNKPSLQKPEFTKEQEKEVQDRVAAILAKKGDKAKTLEEQVEEQGKTIKSLQADKLKATAERFGLTVEQVSDAGIIEPSKVEALAKLFGKTQESAVKPPLDDPKPDSNVSIGGGELTEEQKLKRRYPKM